MRAVRLTTTSGETWTTDVNGSKAEIDAYFLGQWFNRGSWDDGDRMVRVVRIDYLS